MSTVTEFDVFACPLAGTNLIEASAGTGKTWALCGLYLRLLLERQLDVQHILVVTFTNAATAELRERIRSRIVETLAHLRNDTGAAEDPFVPHLVATLRSARGLADGDMIARLDLAVQTFDEAAILTIHGFCQRALTDIPFAARMPLALEQVQDDSEFVREAANDFWRRRVAGDRLTPELAATLVECKDSPTTFAVLLKRHLAKPLSLSLWPTAIDLPAAVDRAALAEAHEAAQTLWHAERQTIVQQLLDALPQLSAVSYKRESVQAAALGWDALLAGSDALEALHSTPGKVDLFGTAKLKPKKGCTAPEHTFFGAAQRLLDLREGTAQTLALTRLALLRDLLADGSRALRSAKHAKRVVAFDDMLFNLYERLTDGDACRLAASLRARFPAALIDEFQDTDPLQFVIFKMVYGSGDAPLFLVGDPKQAIYSFRNADLHTYLQARTQASAEYTLIDNQRATQPLIDALNGLFGANGEAFMLPGLAYRQVGFGARPRKDLVDCSEPRAPLQVWTLPTDPASGEPLLKKDARAAVVAATASEIARLLTAAGVGQITLAGQALRAGDIAVLVRSHAQGSAVRQALSELGVGSVELSQASVYRSPDAEELERLLAAILEPTRERLLKAALATELMGLDAAAIEALAGDEAQMLGWVQRFAGCRQAWLARGVGFMLRELMRSERLPERLLLRADGERRLTNLLHLAECLQQAAEAHPAPDALLRWFQTQRLDERSDDATQLRLASDRNLVQIVTIHKSKGLEYPIVFCPFVWDGRRGGFPDRLAGVEYHDDAGRTVIDYRKGFAGEFDERDVKRRTRLENAAEDLRLIYVALTRAMHRCVLVAGGYLGQSFGNTHPTESARSPLNWLVAGQGLSPQAWFDGTQNLASITAAWAALAAQCGPALALAPLPKASGRPVPEERPPADALGALPAPQRIPSACWIGSYSALTDGATHEQAAVDHDLRAVQMPMLPAAEARLDDDDILRFPRGSAAGVCLHAVFERIDFMDAAGWPTAIADALRLHGAALPGGNAASGGETAALGARMLHRLLRDVLATPLPVGTAQPLRLHGVPRGRRLTELEFHLPSDRLEAEALNAALAELGYTVPRLAFTALRGYLKGFIDLVLEHDGRYFIVDWKSNHLGDTVADYAEAPLAAAMAAQGYHLQALLYSVALERLLRHRVPGYDAGEHFGGVLYLFVRGVRPGWKTDSGTPAGLHFHRPTPEAIRRVSALFDSAGADA
jgi:exodeoxyribonuclease V beta subunit